MAQYKHAKIPSAGETVTVQDGTVNVPDKPIVPFIEGDGIGPDIWHASRAVVDAAVAHAYGGSREVMWMEVYAGEKAQEKTESGCPTRPTTRCASSRWPSRARSLRRWGRASARST